VPNTMLAHRPENQVGERAVPGRSDDEQVGAVRGLNEHLSWPTAMDSDRHRDTWSTAEHLGRIRCAATRSHVGGK
jgi:hypothetical protein